MSTITQPTPGSHYSNGVTAGDTQTLAIGTSAANGDTISYNARWQWNLTTAESTANAGSNLALQAIADDGKTVIATSLSVVRSTGVVTLLNGSSVITAFADGSVSAPSVGNVTNPASGIYFTTNAVNVAANGVRAAIFNTATTGVNYLSVTPGAAGTGVTITSAGSDTDIQTIVTGKGAGGVRVGGTTGNVILGPGTALATSAVAGHAAIPTCAGTPTGAPTGHTIGKAQIILDTTASKLWLYLEGTGWVGVAVA